MSLKSLKQFFAQEIARVSDNHLYHATTAYVARQILKSDSLVLPLSETNTSESKFAKKLFYLSFARTPASGYIADRAKGLRSVNYPVLFVFDKSKLLMYRDVAIKPVDYWGADASGRVIGGGAKEAEERLFSNKPILNKLRSAIVEVRIITDFEKYTNNEYLLEVVVLCKKSKIPVKLFDAANKQGFLLGKPRAEEQRTVLNQLKALGFSKRKNEDYTGSTRAKIIKKKIPKWGTNNWLNVLTELVHQDNRDALSESTRSKLWYILDSIADFKQSFSADIHNLRSGHAIDKQRFYKLLEHVKAKSINDFFEKLFSKWKSKT